MERAMAQAEDEVDSDDSWVGFQVDKAVSRRGKYDDEEARGEEAIDHVSHHQIPHSLQSLARNTTQHLPDAIFSAAANSRKSPIVHSDVASDAGTDRDSASQPRKRRRPGSQFRDAVVGSRNVRPIALAARIGSESSMRPPRASKAFVDHRLISRRRLNDTWERKSAHLTLASRLSTPVKKFATSRASS